MTNQSDKQPDELTYTEGLLRLCCADPANLRLLPPDSNIAPGIEIRVCRTCDRRHYTMNVEPIHYGIKSPQ